ncbi:MAG: MlaE family lipid ABC transporter permease subunit [Bacteroidales bacterium]
MLESVNTSCRFENNTLFISGRLGVNDAGNFTKAALKKLRTFNLPEITINLEELNDIDSAGVTALFYLKRKLSKNIPNIKIEGENKDVGKKIELFSSDIPIEEKPDEEFEITEAVGRKTHTFITTYLYGFLLLAANTLYWAAVDLFRTKTTREGEFVNQCVNIGVNAALIIIVMSYAIGFVMAVQSAQYLQEFGADIYIVDLVVISIMSQMGPLIAGVLIAGRSGSSIAAEVATMRVTAELDALKTMGLDPVRYVVVPKLYASLFTIPLLIILSDVAGITGGATAAYYNLDITPEIFINRMSGIMQNKDLLTAFIKSQVYAFIIVLTGSYYGFSVEKGAEGVGKVTTRAVVVSISLVILADSLMAVLFY